MLFAHFYSGIQSDGVQDKYIVETWVLEEKYVAFLGWLYLNHRGRGHRGHVLNGHVSDARAQPHAGIFHLLERRAHENTGVAGRPAVVSVLILFVSLVRLRGQLFGAGNW